MILSDTNVLSTFAKIDRLALLVRLFEHAQIGVVPAVYEELRAGVTSGYGALQSAITLIEQGQIALLAPTAQEIFEKDALPDSFDAGERETVAVAKARGYQVLTNETQVKNWCKRAGMEYWDLPGVLRALWRMDFLTKEQARELIAQIEAKDRVIFRNQEEIFQE